MSRKEVIPDVANDRVKKVKAQFESEGATVTVKDNGDGTSKVTAVFPD